MSSTSMGPYIIKLEELIRKIKCFRLISNPKKVSLNSIPYFIDSKQLYSRLQI